MATKHKKSLNYSVVWRNKKDWNKTEREYFQNEKAARNAARQLRDSGVVAIVQKMNPDGSTHHQIAEYKPKWARQQDRDLKKLFSGGRLTKAQMRKLGL